MLVDTLLDIFSTCCSIAVIFGGLIPYVPQYLKIKQSQRSEGFSTYVCLTLIIANILRILFWFGHTFDIALLIQSFVMITGMLVMMQLCVKITANNRLHGVASPNIAEKNQESRNEGQNGPYVSNTADECNGINTNPSDIGPGAIKKETTPIYSVLYSNHDLNRASDSPASPSIEAPGKSYSPSLSLSLVDSPPRKPTELGLSMDCSDVISESPLASSSSMIQLTTSGLMYESQGSPSTLPASRTIHECAKCLVKDFWKWTNFTSYLKFLFLFTAGISMVTYLLLHNHLYIETLGFAAVLTESLLGFPQLLQNYCKKSTSGMSVEMVIMWLAGDLFKFFYFIFRETPIQFYVCGSIQVVVDILILSQVIWYKYSRSNYWHLPQTTARHQRV